MDPIYNPKPAAGLGWYRICTSATPCILVPQSNPTQAAVRKYCPSRLHHRPAAISVSLYWRRRKAKKRTIQLYKGATPVTNQSPTNRCYLGTGGNFWPLKSNSLKQSLDLFGFIDTAWGISTWGILALQHLNLDAGPKSNSTFFKLLSFPGKACGIKRWVPMHLSSQLLIPMGIDHSPLLNGKSIRTAEEASLLILTDFVTFNASLKLWASTYNTGHSDSQIPRAS